MRFLSNNNGNEQRFRFNRPQENETGLVAADLGVMVAVLGRAVCNRNDGIGREAGPGLRCHPVPAQYGGADDSRDKGSVSWYASVCGAKLVCACGRIEKCVAKPVLDEERGSADR